MKCSHERRIKNDVSEACTLFPFSMFFIDIGPQLMVEGSYKITPVCTSRHFLGIPSLDFFKNWYARKNQCNVLRDRGEILKKNLTA